MSEDKHMNNSENKVTIQEWILYVQGECSVVQSERLEWILEQDENALELYMQALEQVEDRLPPLTEPDHFVDSVMVHLPVMASEILFSEKIVEAKRRWYEHKLFHYAVAACLTLIFLSAGWFDKLSPESLEKSDTSRGSYSQELVRVTTDWIDRFKP
ncbi:hypothetical protein [Paenibacillus pini]|uniref:Uncharacterized protein n=1 Tax=Paenibacillus pini JCM 16418 TaxID=1236976 RepID=W7YDX8_9BACL|nr:hypothetical protein [Paenibacillus pini]GAF09115.1 hypothetical protein JCM16418_3234 [Paenibacillus pini JCM 16418]